MKVMRIALRMLKVHTLNQMIKIKTKIEHKVTLI